LAVKYTALNLDHPGGILSAGNSWLTEWLDIHPSHYDSWPTKRFLFGVGDVSDYSISSLSASSGLLCLFGTEGWFNSACVMPLSAPSVTTATGYPIRIAVHAGRGDYISGVIERVWIGYGAMTLAQKQGLCAAMMS
jgi:hypothetical protein